MNVQDSVNLSNSERSVSSWAKFILENMPKPKTMITLTYREEVHPAKARQNLIALIGVLNRDALGQDYKKFCKHSYFSYFFATEYQKRGVLHWHGLVDNWINYQLVHDWWNSQCGFAWVEKVTRPTNWRSQGTIEGSARYVAKYVAKTSPECVEMFFSDIVWSKTASGAFEKSPATRAPVKGER